MTPEDLILKTLAQFPNQSGPQLCDITGLRVSQLYPAIFRLERDKKIIGEWHEEWHKGQPYPRTRRYQIK